MKIDDIEEKVVRLTEVWSHFKSNFIHKKRDNYFHIEATFAYGNKPRFYVLDGDASICAKEGTGIHDHFESYEKALLALYEYLKETLKLELKDGFNAHNGVGVWGLPDPPPPLDNLNWLKEKLDQYS